MPKNGLRTKLMGFANKMSESIIAERLYLCSQNALLFAKQRKRSYIFDIDSHAELTQEHGNSK